MKTKFFYVILVCAMCAFVFSSMVVLDAWDVPDKYNNMENPYTGQEDDDEIGDDLFSTHCKSCHGKEGFGDGSKAEELESEMRDFTSEEVQEQSDGVLYYKTFIGRDEMPNFEKKINDEEERWLLVNYIRILVE